MDETDDDPVAVAAANWERHGWEGGPLLRAALSIIQTEGIIRKSSTRALRSRDLTHSRHEVLALLYFSRGGELSLGKISDRLMVHPTSITTTVDALERLGFVERVAHPTDRRGVLARITDKGRACIEASTPEVAASKHGLASLTEDEAETIYRILKKVRLGVVDS
jgi:DNA-binding MarR family transcriptional regulator